MTNPIDNYVEMRKAAGFASEFAGGFGGKAAPRALGSLAAVGLGTGALTGAGIVANKIRMAITKKQDFDAMMHHNPDLEQARTGNPELFAQQYTSLRNVSPQFAQDPLIAGTFMRRMSEYPGAAGTALIEAHKSESTDRPMWLEKTVGQLGGKK